ncbi:MAG: hypothetical protein IT270_08415 [Saprospiraceae bacterium]|nr:hypothetical protein [Saprospiraceae bacterium]
MKSASMTTLCRFSLLFVGFQSLFVLDTHAQPLQWTQIEGVYSGEVTHILVHPATFDVVLTTDRKIYKWYENSRTWKPINMGLGYDPVIDYASAGSVDDVYFGWGNKVFYSHDFGENWMSQDIFPNTLGGIFSICGTEDGRVLAVAATTSGMVLPEIYFSTDRATTWTTVLSDIPFFPNKIIYDEENELFLAATSKGVWKSANNGLNWTSMNQGAIDEMTSLRHIHKVKNTGTLLASTVYNVFRSADDGQTWTQIPGNMFGWGGFDDDGAGIIYKCGDEEGLYVSTDDGITWAERLDEGMPAELNLVKFGNNGALYVSGSKHAGLLRYDETSEQWIQVGVPEYAIQGIHAVPNTDVVLVATDDSLFRSTDKGMTWQRANGGIDHPFFSGVGQYGNEVVAMNVFEGFYFSSDLGQSWSQGGGSLPTQIGNNMISTNLNKLFVTTGFEIAMSPDKGVSWVSYTQGLPAQMPGNTLAYAKRIGQPGYLYCDVPFGNFYRTNISVGGPPNWQPYDNGLPEDLLFGSVASLDNNTLLAFSNDELYKTSTLSDQWTTVLHPTGILNLNALMAVDSLRWVAGTQTGIYFTTNGGQSWQTSNDGLLDIRIRSLAVNQDGYVLAGTEDGGLYYSEGLVSSIQNIQNTQKAFSLWPNPAHDFVTVEGAELNNNDWYASDVLGRKIALKSQNGNGSLRLDVKDLAPGIWWIGTEGYVGKMVVKD